MEMYSIVRAGNDAGRVMSSRLINQQLALASACGEGMGKVDLARAVGR